MNYSDISDFAFRKKRIEKGYDILINLVSGIDETYWDENQDSSIKQKVSSELINTIELYRGRRLEFMSDKSLLENLEPDPLSQEDRELYRTFLDTVISLAVHNEHGWVPWYSKAGTWRAVIERIERPLSYKNAAELHKDLLIWNEIVEAGGETPFLGANIPEGIFYSLSCAYRVVTGGSLSSLLTEEQRKMAMDLMTEAEREYLKEATVLDSKSEMVKDSMRNDWKACFDSGEMRKSCTLLLDKGVDLYNRKYFREDCINTLHIILSQFGIGSWFDEDIFFAVYENVKKAIRYSKKAIGEVHNGD